MLLKKAILTGGTGFIGYWLLKKLVENEVFVYVVCRKNSTRIDRITAFENIKIIELDMNEIELLPDYINEQCSTFYHLAWEGQRNDIDEQFQNVGYSLNTLKTAKKLGCQRFIVTGSQAEYGISTERIYEDSDVLPNTAYGASKLACYNLIKVGARLMNLEYIWVRIFSVYGPKDNSNTLISYLFHCFENAVCPNLTDCNQLWDYLYCEDAAEALYLLGESKHSNELYNLAYGKSEKLRRYVEILEKKLNSTIDINFGGFESSTPIVSLDVSCEKLFRDLGWRPKHSFEEGIGSMMLDPERRHK